MKLYYSPAACSLAVHIVAREAGLDFHLVKVDLVKHLTESGTDLSAVNSKNYVPAVELDDGQVLTEVAPLVQWIAEQAPESGLLPPAGTLERFRVQEWLNFIATELHKSFSPWLWHKETAESTREAVLRKLAIRFALIEDRLGTRPYLAGESLTVADAYAFTIISWSNFLKVDLAPFPRIRDYLARIAARPSVQEAMAAEGLIRKAA
jgi:glutathione S-transferase